MTKAVTSGAMPFLFLTEDANGVSHFEDREIPLFHRDFAPPAAGMPVSQPVPTRQMVFLTLPAGWTGVKHPSPRRQMAMCLSGRLRVEAGSGEIREIGTGAIWWMEDVAGDGHTTSVVGAEDVRLAVGQLDEG